MKTLAILAASAFLAASGPASAQEAAPDTGVRVDPTAYEGLWYEIARAPAPFQERCDGGVTALYEIVDAKTVRIINRCDLPDGEAATVEGAARVLNESFNAFQVDFPQSPPDQTADYLVEAVGPIDDGRYVWAAVRSPEGYAWILARSPELDEQARREAEQALEDVGLDRARLQPTDQPPENYDPERQ